MKSDKEFHVIMRKDLSARLYEGDDLMVSRNLHALEKVAKSFGGIVKTYNESIKILRKTQTEEERP